jgi:mRNA interferase RelE/StbE
LAWTIESDEAAVKRLRKLVPTEAKRLRDFPRDRMASANDPRILGKALKGTTLGSLWRYRVGDYRILCELNDDRLIVLVVEIGHRREVYRQGSAGRSDLGRDRALWFDPAHNSHPVSLETFVNEIVSSPGLGRSHQIPAGASLRSTTKVRHDSPCFIGANY